MKLKGETSPADLYSLAKKLNVEVDRIYDIQEIPSPLPSRGSFIILLDNGSGDGHWVAVFNSEYYDSMAEPPPTVLGKMKSWNRKQVQSSYGQCCGEWCLLYLYDCQHNTDLMKDMTNLSLY